MRKLFEGVEGRIRSFIAQRSDLAMVVRCSESESPAVLKIVETVSESSHSSLFWVFSEEFAEPKSYASVLTTGFVVKHEAVRLAMAEKGIPPLPPAPQSLLDPTLPPVERLREMMIFGRSLLPAPEGCHAVWGLFPVQIRDANAYALLLAELLQHEYPFPWCHHMRFIIRDDPAGSVLPQTLANQPRVSWYAPDLSPQAMEKALEDEAADEGLPLDQRMHAVLTGAIMDASYQRSTLALDKFQLLFRYFVATRNAPMAALVLNSTGEVHQRMGNHERAGRCFETALEPACDPPNPPILLNVLLNLGNLRMAETRWTEAEAYYDSAEQLATVQRNPAVKIQSIENRGYCQYMQGQADKAAESWVYGAAIAERLGQPQLRQSILQRLRAHYVGVNDYAKRLEVEQQLISLAQPGQN